MRFMLDGDRVERMISDWLERNYPEGPTWYDRPDEASVGWAKARSAVPTRSFSEIAERYFRVTGPVGG